MATAMRKMILVSMTDKKRNKEFLPVFFFFFLTNLFGFKVRLMVLVQLLLPQHN